MALKDVKAWSKNFKQSMKYSFEDYFKSSTPAMYDANEKYADTLRDYSNRLIDTVNNGQNIRVRDLFKKIPVFQDVKTLYKNSIEDIKTGKFYNKERMDAAMEKTMQDQLGGGFIFDMDFDKSFDANMDMGFDDLNNSTNDTDTFSQDFDIGMQASASTISSATLTGSSMVSDTIRASTQYTSIQIFETNQILKRCFGDLNRNVMDIVGFNKTTLTTHIENATQYFQKTTELMSENNAILKEMLEMQRNMYKNAQEQEYQKSDRITYSDIVGSNGLPDLDKLKEYFKQQYKGSMFGMLGDLNKMGMKDMLLSAPLQFITNTLASTIIGPRLDRSLKDFDKTVSGIFAGMMQKLNNTADKGDIFNPLTWIADMFGLKTYEKTTINTANFVKGPMPFNGLANYSLINVIPNYLRNIEAALTGGPVRVFNYDTGKWTTDVAISKQYSYERNRDLSYAFSPVSDAAAPYLQSISFEKNGKVDKKAQKQLFADFANFLMSTVDDNGYFEFDFDQNKKLRDRREYQRRNVSSAENMDIIANILDSIPGYRRTQMMGSVRQFKDSRTRAMDEIERGFVSPYRDLFNDAFIYDYSAGVTTRYGPAMQGGKRFSGGQKILEKNNPILNALNNIHKESFITRHILEDIRDNGGGFSPSNNNPVGGRGPVRNKKRRGKSREEALWERRNKNRSNMDKANDEFYPIYKAIGESYENQSVTGIFGENYYDRMNINEEDILKSIRKNSEEINEQARKYSSSDQYQGMFDKKFYARYNALKGETATDKIKNADTLKDRFVAVTGFLVQLRDKPAEFMANLVDSMNDSINNFFFNRPTNLIDEDGRKVEGFFDTSVYYLKKVFGDASDYLVNNVFDPLSNYIDENFDEDSKIRQGKDVLFDVARSIKSSFKRVGRDIMGKSKGDIGEDGEMSLAWKKWMVEQYGPYNYDDILKREKERKENPNYQDDMSQRYIDRVILELINKGEIPSVYGGKAFGDRYIKKTGLYALSKGEAVIPSTRNPFNPYLDSADTKKDARNEKFLLNKYKRMGIPVEGSYAEGTLTDDALEEKTYREKLAKAKEKAIDELEEVYPDLLRGASYGALGGLIFQGGPYGILAGSAIGTGLAIAKNSQSVQEFLFGNMENYQDGFLGKFKLGQFLKKYGPAMKDYGIVGAVAGSFLPIGALGGMLIGAAAGWASQSDKFQELIFGTDEKRNKVQRFLNEHMLRGVAGVTIGGLAGGALLGPFGAVGGTLLGGALSFASTTDKFKDMMLGELDPATGKRKGGLVSKIEAVTIGPLKDRMKDMQDTFLNYMKKQILSPIDRLAEPLVQYLKFGLTDTFKRVGEFAKDQFSTSKMKFFFDRIFGGESRGNILGGAGIGGLAGMLLGVDPLMAAGIGGVLGNTRVGRWIGRNTVGRIAKIPAGIARGMGRVGDALTRRNIERGIATNMTAEERRNVMAGRDYAFSQFDTALAGASSEDLQGMLSSLEGYNERIGSYRQNVRNSEDALLDTIRTSGVDRKYWNTLLNAAKSGDSRKLLKAFEKTNASNMPREDRERFKKQIAEAAKNYTKNRNVSKEMEDLQKIAKDQGMDLSNTRSVDKYRNLIKAELDAREKQKEENKEDIPENDAATITNTHLAQMTENTQGMIEYLDAILNVLSGNPINSSSLTSYIDNSRVDPRLREKLASRYKIASEIKKDVENTGVGAQAAYNVANTRFDAYGANKIRPILDKLGTISDEDRDILLRSLYKDSRVFDQLGLKLFQTGQISDAKTLGTFSNLDRTTASRVYAANQKSGMEVNQDNIKLLTGMTDDEFNNNIKPFIKANIIITDPSSLIQVDPMTIKQMIKDNDILREAGIDLNQTQLEILQKNTSIRPDIINAIAIDGDPNKAVNLLARIHINATRDYTKKFSVKSAIGTGVKAVGRTAWGGVAGTISGVGQAGKAIVGATGTAISGTYRGAINAADYLYDASNYYGDRQSLDREQQKILAEQAKQQEDINNRQNIGKKIAYKFGEEDLATAATRTFALGGIVEKTGPIIASAGEQIISNKSADQIEKDIKNESKEIDKLRDRADAREDRESRRSDDSSDEALDVLTEAMSGSIQKAVDKKLDAAKADPNISSTSPNTKEVSTQYGIQTYKRSTNGQYALDNTKANKDISDKIQDEIDDRKDANEYLKQIVDNTANIKGIGGSAAVAQPKEKGLLDTLLDSILPGGGGVASILESLLGMIPGGAALAPFLIPAVMEGGKKVLNFVTKPFRWAGNKIDQKILQPGLQKVAERFGLKATESGRFGVLDMAKQAGNKFILDPVKQFGMKAISKVTGVATGKRSGKYEWEALKQALRGKADRNTLEAAATAAEKLTGRSYRDAYGMVDEGLLRRESDIIKTAAKEKLGSAASGAIKSGGSIFSRIGRGIGSIGGSIGGAAGKVLSHSKGKIALLTGGLALGGTAAASAASHLGQAARVGGEVLDASGLGPGTMLSTAGGVGYGEYTDTVTGNSFNPFTGNITGASAKVGSVVANKGMAGAQKSAVLANKGIVKLENSSIKALSSSGTALETAGSKVSGAVSSVSSKLGVATNEMMVTIVNKIKSCLEIVLPKAAQMLPGSISKYVYKFGDMVLKQIQTPEMAKKFLSKGALSLIRAGGIADPINYAFATWYFFDGWNNAAKYWELKEGVEATLEQKAVSAIVNAISQLIPIAAMFLDAGFYIPIAKKAFGINTDNQQNDPNRQKSVLESGMDKASYIISHPFNALGDQVKSVVKSITDYSLKSAKDAYSYIYGQAASIGATVSKKAGELWASIKQTASKYLPSLDDVKDTVGSGIETVKQWGSDAYDFVANGASSLANSISDFIDRRTSTGPNTGKGKYGRGAIDPSNFASQLDPSVQQRYNAPGDTEYQTMADSGCGPGAAANAVAGLGGNLNISAAANYALNNGYKEKNGGTKPQYFSDILGKLGMTTDNVSRNNQSIISNLKQGNPVILMGKDDKVSDETPFGPGVHYVTATGINDQGNIIVQDSESDGPNKVYPTNKVLNRSTIAIAAKKKTAPARFARAESNPKMKGSGLTMSGMGRYGRGNNFYRRFGRGYRFGRGTKAGPAIWDMLHKVGFNDIGAAGVMGNMMKESNLYPDIVQGDPPTHAPEITCDGQTGYGLCQWTYLSRQQGLVDFARQNNTSTSDPALQVSYIVHEYPDLPSQCNNCNSPSAAAMMFHEIYEGSADGAEGKMKRQQWAEEAFRTKGDISEANAGDLSSSGVYSSGSSSSSGSSGQTKSYSGLFGQFDKVSDKLDSALSSLGLGKYGRSKYGRAKEDTTSTTADTTNTTSTTDTKNSSIADKAKSAVSTISGGMFDNLLSPFDSKISQITDSFTKAASPFKNALKKLSDSPIGKAVSSIFGGSIFDDFFGGSESSGNKGGQPGSGGVNAGGNSSNPDINAASQYANSRVGTQGYGNNGCTTWVNDYLSHAGMPPIDKWVPTAYADSQKGTPARWKDPSEGAVEGDVAVIETNQNRGDGPDHVVIADGQGGYWGNSSSKNKIVHSSMAGDWGAENIWGYIGTGGDGSGNVAQGGMTRDASEAAGDATLDGQGKYGRSKYGRSIRNTFLEKQKHLKKSVFGRAKEVFDAINSNYDAGYNEQQASIDAVSPALNMAEAAQNANAAIAQTQVQAKQDSDKVDVMIGLLSSMNNYLSIIVNGIANLGGAAAPATVAVNNVNAAPAPTINPMDLPETFNRDDLKNIVEAMTSIAKKK